MSDPLREPGFLTAHQLRAVQADGDIFLTACPGSGKTRAAGVRVARLADDGRRAAACSYTNVGVEQIRRVLADDLRRPLDARHFVGTLHSFLLRYVLYPFGHLATGSAQTPRLVGDDAGWRDVVFGGDNRIRLPISRFRYRPDGTLCVRSVPPKFPHQPDDAARIGQADAQRLKGAAARSGVLSFDDAMYWALRVLGDVPGVAACVAARFDELLVDEAQDTSELQLACLSALCATGKLDSLVLVGDLEQSISAYTGASRAGCEALAADRGITGVEFSENHRSSQKICDVAVHFCSRDTPDRAVGEDADCPCEPELLLYAARQPDVAVQRFRERLDELGHDPAHAAVLARSNALVDELNGQTTAVEIRPRPLTVGRAVRALRGAGTLGRRDLEAVDRIVAFAATDTADLSELDEADRWRVRQATMKLLRTAPDLDQDLRSWIRGTARVLGEVVATIADAPRPKPGQVLTSQAAHEGHVAAEVLVPVVHKLRAQTVHDIKGESRAAVLVVVDRLRSRRHGAQSDLWSSPLLGEAVAEDDAEELRIAVVALTRARRYCALALPDTCSDEVLAAFESVGFRVT
jgi:superfamily I DNA/RNA helicase